MLAPFPPTIGGITTSVQYLIHSPVVESVEFIPVPTMSRKHGTSAYANEWKLLKIVRTINDMSVLIKVLMINRPHLIHINTSFNSGAFWRDTLYLIICRIFRKKIFLHVHGGQLADFMQKYPKPVRGIIRRILRIPNRIAVLSDYQLRPFQEFNLNGHVKIIPNMIHCDHYHLNKTFRAQFNIPVGKVVILFIASHLTKQKGVTELLRVAEWVIEKHQNVHFVIVGQGREEENMQSYCNKVGIQKNISFLGFLKKDQIIRVLNSVDILILPSYGEGFPMVILEAMSAGLPIISTSVGAVPEILIEGKHGFLVSPKDVHSLFDKTECLISNPELREQMGIANRERVKQHYDLPIVAEIFKRCYVDILKSR